MHSHRPRTVYPFALPSISLRSNIGESFPETLWLFQRTNFELVPLLNEEEKRRKKKRKRGGLGVLDPDGFAVKRVGGGCVWVHFLCMCLMA